MKKILRVFPVVLLALFAGIYSGCEWDSGSDSSYNTSQGSGVALNISGIYVPRVDGDMLVSGTDITRLQITQTGSKLTALDSNGRTYEGTTGSPGLIAAPTSVNANGVYVYPEGALLASLSVTLWIHGPSPSIHDDVSFNGFIRFVAKTELEATIDQTQLTLPAGPLTIDQLKYGWFAVDERNTMMVLEGQWNELGTIAYFDGWSSNFTVFWTAPAGSDTTANNSGDINSGSELPPATDQTQIPL